MSQATLSNSAPILRSLVQSRAKALEVKKNAEVEVKRIDEQIAQLIDPQTMIAAAGKDSGQVSENFNGIKITVKADKKVKWDSNVLMAAASKLDWAQTVSLFDIDFSMKEAKYNALVENVTSGLAPHLLPLLNAVKEARTVEITAAKVQAAEVLED